MEKENQHSVAIVTGGASGIGLATGQALAEAGYAVAIVDLSRDGAAQAAAQIAERSRAQTTFAAADVADPGTCSAAFDHIRGTLGPASILVNNAGIVVRQKGRLEDLPPEHFEEMMAIHVGGTLNWCRLVLPDMRQARYGRIINISSVNAIAAVPYRISYVTAKKAVRGITEALALETARAGITVNAIAPGYVLTDVLEKRAEQGILDKMAIAERTPVGRWGHPEEIAKAAVYLASQDAGFVTGSTLVIDGGLSIRGDAGEDLDLAPEAT